MHGRQGARAAVWRLALGGLALALVTGCTVGQPGKADAPQQAERKRVLAPVDDARIERLDTEPGVYVLHLQTGLPSGCASFDGLEMARDERHIKVTVWNSMPKADNIACTMIYGTARNRLELGSDFEPGERYEVEINEDRTLELIAR